MTQIYEIKNRWTGDVLFTYELQDGQESGMIERHALEEAISKGVNLRDANLRGANLRDANLRGANLRDANLEDANLEDANLLGANLRGANLRDANLLGANLEGANNAPLIIHGLRWHIYVSGTGKLRIGCQEHSIEAWKDFSDKEITPMDSNALEFWSKHKSMLLGICDIYKHEVATNED